MSYLALARKWRPTQFSEVVGQAHVLTALENALAQNRLHHAYLFSGTRGVGKTTIGRLFAKGLNCETGITAHPCGQCAACQEIEQGRFVDLLEIDAASRTKVEDTRELLDNVQYKPARGRFKVYLIDEVHMLSRHSFNALLKTLEEPPEYVKFLLATTDPQKLPVTILSRCLQFHLKPIGIDHIEQQLAFVLNEEQVTAEPRALGMIAHAADGSMRDALSLTDQAIALGDGTIEANLVSHMLGTIDTDQALHLLQALSHKQPQTVMAYVDQIAANGIAWDALLQSLATQIHRIAMYQMLPSTLDKLQPDADKIKQLAQDLSAEDVQLFYQIALKGREDLPLSPTPRIGLEMVLLRMLAFRPVAVSPIHGISTEVSSDVATQQPAIMANAPTESTIAPATSVSPQDQPEFQQTQSESQPETSEIIHTSPESATHPNHVSQPAAETQSAAPADSEVPAAPPTAHDTPSSPRVGLRHQLRSQRQSVQSGASNKGTSTKKSETASTQSDSVFDRLMQKRNDDLLMPSVVDSQLDAEDTDGPYQWRPTIEMPEKPVDKSVTPAALKKALAHEKTPEMTARLADEVIQEDEWAAIIPQLNLPKLIEQLALNASYQLDGNTVHLSLREHQAHLNTDKAQAILKEALEYVLGMTCALEIRIGDDGVTPLERRELRYQAKLEQAFASLHEDSNVQFIQQRFQAQLDQESVRPV
ncbi:DNA polymerase III subunit tau [Vibrio ruber DSM 16370]|uniref:DNA polymerase III subunit gamma/tau n=1 Tax=Vibrio ruber (strain DSM 16370 / JCM 11486 / BCRC 17186 / CECT 7878 / LMG 23124 / VR1) TaxID=1123498 RepID=A0A1R4LKS9_VIBR1|nr:DNA polymerase III subunit gamma/tau [Vibrio ruber]SJN57068.1 DNA polymerase III subunit tau [Vibrio ruber DSM 16370]